MKLSTLILGTMTVAVLSACQDKKKTTVTPATEQTATDNGNHQAPDPSNECPACGMG